MTAWACPTKDWEALQRLHLSEASGRSEPTALALTPDQSTLRYSRTSFASFPLLASCSSNKLVHDPSTHSSLLSCPCCPLSTSGKGRPQTGPRTANMSNLKNQFYIGSVERLWPRRLLDTVSMISHERQHGDTYDNEKEPNYSIVSYTWGRFALWDAPLEAARLPITGRHNLENPRDRSDLFHQGPIPTSRQQNPDNKWKPLPLARHRLS